MNNFSDFLIENESQDAYGVIENEKLEIDLFNQYGDYYSYGFYIAEKM